MKYMTLLKQKKQKTDKKDNMLLKQKKMFHTCRSRKI